MWLLEGIWDVLVWFCRELPEFVCCTGISIVFALCFTVFMVRAFIGLFKALGELFSAIVSAIFR